MWKEDGRILPWNINGLLGADKTDRHCMAEKTTGTIKPLCLPD
jgi:hypothetical protein